MPHILIVEDDTDINNSTAADVDGDGFVLHSILLLPNGLVNLLLGKQVEQGDIYGFIGQNGAGKSTTLKLLCGLARPTQGEAFPLECES